MTRLVATGHLQTCYNLLKQHAASLWMTSFDVDELSQDMRTHSDIGFLITSLLQDVSLDVSVIDCIVVMMGTLSYLATLTKFS